MKKIILLISLFFSISFFGQPGTLDLTFNQTDLGSGNLANGAVKTTMIQSDGKIIIGGSFTTYNGNAINRIARLNTDGSLDNTFNVGIGPNYDVNDISIQSDGKIIIGGSFTLFNGFPKVGVVRLNIDGTLDNSFYNNNLVGPADPTTVNTNIVYSTSIQSDGKIIIGGILRFQLNSSAYHKIARLNTNGSLDTSFNITLQGHPVYTTSIQSDGKIIIGGGFSSPNGVTSYLISRLNTDGTIDNTFNVGTGPNNAVTTTSIQADGKIIIGGNFTLCHGISRNRIARLNSDGSHDTTFNPGTGANGIIRTISIQSDGKIIIGGDFTTYNGTPTNYFARLNADGTLDTAFNIGTGPNGLVRSISIQSDGKIIIGGDFTSYNGIGKNRIARINSGAALSNPSFDLSTTVIYPNPSNGYFNIKIDDNVTTKTIEVYTLLGQKIYSKQITENTSAIDLSNQSKGIYIYKINTIEGESKSGKLIID